MQFDDELYVRVYRSLSEPTKWVPVGLYIYGGRYLRRYHRIVPQEKYTRLIDGMPHIDGQAVCLWNTFTGEEGKRYRIFTQEAWKEFCQQLQEMRATPLFER